MGCRFPGQRRTAGKGSSTLLPDTRDHTKDWLQSYNGGAVSHCARAAGKQTEPPVSVPVRLGPIAPDPLPGSHPIPACVLCLHPTLLLKLTLRYPSPTWQPLIAHPCQALAAISYLGQIILLLEAGSRPVRCHWPPWGKLLAGHCHWAHSATGFSCQRTQCAGLPT